MKVPSRWAPVYIYTVGIFIVTPFLPNLIRFVSSQWSRSGASRFVLWTEIAIALFILVLCAGFLPHRKKKSAAFLLSVGGIFLLSYISYRFIPNPYEFTHLPEYAVLSMLLVRALDKGKAHINLEKGGNLKSAIIKNPYVLSASITGIIGTGDEVYQYILPNRYFTVYDIFLNILGGILGLLIFWRIKR